MTLGLVSIILIFPVLLAHNIMEPMILRSDFPNVFHSFRILLKRLGGNLWRGEDTAFLKVVFDAIKDNASYCSLLSTLGTPDELDPLLAWFGEYLDSARDLPMYPEALAKVIDFMCEELQHERFREARPFAMLAATRVSCLN